MSEDQAMRLLQAVTEAGQQQAEARRELSRSYARRVAAIEAAMDAGIPRRRIAEAAGITLARMYSILATPPKETE